MRFITPLAIASIFAITACQDESAEIGKFDVELNGKSMVFQSFYDQKNDNSGITILRSSHIRMIQITGYAGKKDGEPDLPLISMTLGNTDEGEVPTLMFIELLDQSYETALMADGPIGQKQIENIVIEKGGKVSFDFSADLVRVTMEDEKPVPDAAGAHIKGRFSGTIPATKLEE